MDAQPTIGNFLFRMLEKKILLHHTLDQAYVLHFDRDPGDYVPGEF